MATLGPSNSPVPIRWPRTQPWVECPPSVPPRVHHHQFEPNCHSDDDSACELGAYFITKPELHPLPYFPLRCNHQNPPISSFGYELLPSQQVTGHVYLTVLQNINNFQIIYRNYCSNWYLYMFTMTTSIYCR